jgi:hypothetical protein
MIISSAAGSGALLLTMSRRPRDVVAMAEANNNPPIFKLIRPARFFMALCPIFPTSLSMVGGGYGTEILFACG